MHTAAVSSFLAAGLAFFWCTASAAIPVELRFVAQGLARAGYTVYCPLLPGLGGGTDSLGLSSWQDWYAALEQAHDELRAHCDVVIAGGISAGSMLALRLARERADQVDGLILFAPTLWPNGWSIPRHFVFFKLVYHKWVAKLMHLRQRAPFGIKDERIRNFVIEFLQVGRPADRGSVRTRRRTGLGIQSARQRGAPPARRDQAADHDHPSA